MTVKIIKKKLFVILRNVEYDLIIIYDFQTFFTFKQNAIISVQYLLHFYLYDLFIKYLRIFLVFTTKKISNKLISNVIFLFQHYHCSNIDDNIRIYFPVFLINRK